MIYNESIRRAINFSIAVHEVDQRQKRKGKEIPYITHPLTVALILARAEASEQTIVAGLLHDTIEDSLPDLPVTTEALRQAFGSTVAELVESVTEPPKAQGWHDRKSDALKRVATYSPESVLIKSADVLANDWELFDDFSRSGASVFARFNVSRTDRLSHQHRMIGALLEQWPESPLADDLRCLATELHSMDSSEPAHERR